MGALNKYKMTEFLKLFSLTVMLCLFTACGGDDNDNNQKPVISTEGIVASPTDCQVYKRGEMIPVRYLFKDNMELGSFNIEIHNNFDHHTHSTSAGDCKLDEKKNAVKPWAYNESFDIPAGQKEYASTVNITIPDTIDVGDYHFMLRLTNKLGWQELKAVSIKITNK